MGDGSIGLGVELLEDRVVPTAAFQTLPILPFSNLAVLDHSQALEGLGKQMGRNPDVILKIGDSNSSPLSNVPPTAYNPGLPYLAPLGSLGYDPNTSGLSAFYGNLLGTWATYRDGPDSLARQGPTAYPGWTTTSVLDALNSQIAVTDAGIALIMIGTNDVLGFESPSTFSQNLTQIVTTLTTAGVVPILSTIPDSHYENGAYHSAVLTFNQVIADVADQYQLPLWNAWAALNQLPNQGLDQYGVHLTTSPNGGGSFYPSDLLYGQNVRNLEALEILNWFQNSVVHATPQFIAPVSPWVPLSGSSAVYAVSREGEFSPTVDVRSLSTGALVDRFLAFGSSFTGGVTLATGEVNGDGVPDVVCGMASEGGALKVFSGVDGSLLARLTPFGSSFTGGLTVAVGDLNGDGVDEIVVGKASGGSGVAVYEDEGGTFDLVSEFQAFPHLHAPGVSVAVANVSEVGPEIAVGAMSGSATVGLFGLSGMLNSVLSPFGSSTDFGVTVAAVDLDGSGDDQLAVARVSGGSGHVRIIDPVTGSQLGALQAGAVVDGNWGLRLGSVVSASGGSDTLLVGNGPGSVTSVLAFDSLSGSPVQLPPDTGIRAYGIFVG